ncbi:hypothetical protein QL093DRAFT_1456015 [Fusarium oxysporum]|nr:hypothetical protein QL093DRAFT_1456015 [Fusarium oxysporum]
MYNIHRIFNLTPILLQNGAAESGAAHKVIFCSSPSQRACLRYDRPRDSLTFCLPYRHRVGEYRWMYHLWHYRRVSRYYQPVFFCPPFRNMFLGFPFDFVLLVM